MKKIFHLATCSTCQRILSEINTDGFELIDIKSQGISESEIEEMKRLSGSFESLFSRRAIKYKQRGLSAVELSETDYKELILEEYTFLKRPVIVDGESIFVGNSKKVVDAAKSHLN